MKPPKFVRGTLRPRAINLPRGLSCSMWRVDAAHSQRRKTKKWGFFAFRPQVKPKKKNNITPEAVPLLVRTGFIVSRHLSHARDGRGACACMQQPARGAGTAARRSISSAAGV